MPPIKRRRLITTCEYCYSHKIKCDKRQPCSSCLRMNTECLYRSNKKDLDKITSSKAPKKTARMVWENPDGITSIYYSRGFQPYLEPGLNRILLFKMAQYTPKPEVLNYSNNGLNSSTNEIISEFPSKQEFDECFWYYWHSIHPLIPILDQQTIQDNYDSFWEKLNANDAVFDVNFALILLAMLFSTKSSHFFNEKDKDKAKSIKSENEAIFNLYEKIKINCGLNVKSTFDFLKASVIILYTGSFYHVGLFSTTSMLSRLAEFMGFHRDPLIHHENPETLSAKEIDCRRYVWNFIRYLDTSTSIQSGLSPHMILINASTEFPSRYDYNPETGEFNGPLSPFRLFNIAMFKSSLVLETVIHCLNFDATSEEELKSKISNVTTTVMALYRDVGGIIGEILSCKGYSDELISFLVAHASGSVHRVFLLHLSGDGTTHYHFNKVISRPSDSLLDFLKFDLKNVSTDFLEKTLKIDSEYSILVIQIMMLFVYETKDKVNTPESLKQFTWFAKNTNPLQYIFFILKDIYGHPNRTVNIDSLPFEIQNFYIPPELLTYQSDLRKFVVDVAFDYMYQYSYLWPALLIDMMDLLVELRKFVYSETNQNLPLSLVIGDTKKSHLNSTISEDDVKPVETHNNNPIPWLPLPLPPTTYAYPPTVGQYQPLTIPISVPPPPPSSQYPRSYYHSPYDTRSQSIGMYDNGAPPIYYQPQLLPLPNVQNSQSLQQGKNSMSGIPANSINTSGSVPSVSTMSTHGNSSLQLLTRPNSVTGSSSPNVETNENTGEHSSYSSTNFSSYS